MYMQNFRCEVTGSTSTKKLAPAKPPVYCIEDQNKCQSGAKQMIAWHRKSFPRRHSLRATQLTIK